MQGRLEHELKINKHIEDKLKYAPYTVREWHTNLMASKKTAATRKDFVNKILAYIEYLNGEEISASSLERYFISVQTKKDKCGNISYTSDSYQQCVWIALNNYCEFLYKRKYISENFVKCIDKPKNNDLERINEHRVLLTKKDFVKIIEAVKDYKYGHSTPEDEEFLRCRDLAMITMLMKTGIREAGY